MRPRPPASQGLRSANHARDKDLEQVRRLAAQPSSAPPSLVRIADTADPTWPVGTAWLDTSGEA